MRIAIPDRSSSTNGNGHGNGQHHAHDGNGRTGTSKKQPSTARVEANRRNARRSTGPRTDAGKRRSSMNAVKHGVCSSSPLLPNECPGTYQTFCEEVREDLRPRTAVERVLVEQITATIWRLRRVGDVERAVLRIERERLESGSEARRSKMKLPPRLAGLEVEADSDGAAEEMWPCEVMARCFASENAQSGPLMLLQRYERSLQNTLMRLMARLDALKTRKNSELYDADEPPVPREYARPVPKPPPPPPPQTMPAPAPVRNKANAGDAEEPDVSADDDADNAAERNEAKPPPAPSPCTQGEGWGEGSSSSQSAMSFQRPAPRNAPSPAPSP